MSMIMINGSAYDTDHFLPKSYTYDSNGRVKTISFTTNGKTYTQTLTYDGNGYMTNESAWVKS